MIVYKYVHPSRTTILEAGLIRFTQSPALNDPFETTPNMHRLEESFREYGVRIVEETSYESVLDYINHRSRVRERVKEHIRNFLTTNQNKYAILSLSKTNNNLLMWAHYCDSHRGFVLGFDSTHAFFQTRRVRAFGVLTEVRYSDERPVMPAPDKWDGSQAQIEQVVGAADLAELFFYTKSRDWAYEQELRMVANPNIADHYIEGPDGQSIFLFKFPPDCLTEIVFGIRMQDDLKRHLTRVIKQQYPHVKVFQAKLNQERFDLDITPVS